MYDNNSNPLEGINNALGNDPEALHDPDRFWNAYRENMPQQQHYHSGHRVSGGGFLISAKVLAIIFAVIVLLGLIFMARNGFIWLFKNAAISADNVIAQVMAIIQAG